MKVLSGILARAIIFALALLLYSLAGAQPSKVQRVGVILPGGAWYETIRGLRDGLRDLSLHEGSQFSLTVRETRGDVSATEEAAKAFEAEKVNLLYTTASSVTLAARRATKDIPIVFCAGDLISKRLEILKEIVPKLHRVLTFIIRIALFPLSLPNWYETRLRVRVCIYGEIRRHGRGTASDLANSQDWGSGCHF